MSRITPEVLIALKNILRKVNKFLLIYNKTLNPTKENQDRLKKLVQLKAEIENHISTSKNLPSYSATKTNIQKEKAKFLGGEVTNESDTNWLVSGASNSKPEHFISVPPNKNTDDMPIIAEMLGGDVDAVWPAGKPIKNYYTSEIVTSGAFKLRDHRNTNISGNQKEGYLIWDFSVYFKESELPEGWKPPN